MKIPNFILKSAEARNKELFFLYNKNDVDEAKIPMNRIRPSHLLLEFILTDEDEDSTGEKSGALLLTPLSRIVDELHITGINYKGLKEAYYIRIIKLEDFLRMECGLFDIKFDPGCITTITKLIEL